MIELRPKNKLQALDARAAARSPSIPGRGRKYLLIRREMYELVRGTLKPYGRGWDDPADDDLIRKDV